MNRLIQLDRGGILWQTSLGNVQFAVPPETIKDTMRLPGGVPEVFIVPHQLFDVERGIALAELEFPVFYNFFYKHRITTVICTCEQKGRLTRAITEAILGPDNLDITPDYPLGAATPGFPNLRAEMESFRRDQKTGLPVVLLSQMVQFVEYDETRRAVYGNLSVFIDEDNIFQVFDQGRKIAELSGYVFFSEKRLPVARLFSFTPPQFGVTVLGAGHGFNPDTQTSGMIIWSNRRGVMVDPPVNAIDSLMELGVNPKLVDNLILTHCHADHDAGILQKILQEGKLNLYTTRTIFESFIRKAAALTGLQQERLRGLVNFFPVQTGHSYTISGAEFRFNYTLHSIPTISMEVTMGGRSMVYSSDTMNSPQYIEQLFEQGVVSRERADFLINFPWDKDLIFHEAGLPPLHTPIDYLLTLPLAVRHRMYLLHTDQEKIPAGADLKIAPTGLEKTIVLLSGEGQYDDAINILDVLNHMEIFSQLSIDKARDFLTLVQKKSFKAGEYVFKENDFSDCFYIILKGAVSIISQDEVLTTYSANDFFGEKSLLLGKNRTADVLANTDLELLSISRDDFFAFIRGSNINYALENLARGRTKDLRHVLRCNSIFQGLTPRQENELHTLVEADPETYWPTRLVLTEESDYCYIIRQGKVSIIRRGREKMILQPGDLLGLAPLFTGGGDGCTFAARTEVKMYRILRRNLSRFVDDNPGVYMRMYYYFSQLHQQIFQD